MPEAPPATPSPGERISSLRAAVERAQEALPSRDDLSIQESPAELVRLRQRLADRLSRDLLPRLSPSGAEELPALLVGIAGPNNVGKSSLFNALAGAPLSPARAEGGLTKQCLAAAHPSLWEGLGALLEARYDVERLPAGTAAPVDRPGPPGKLYLALSETLPRGFLLIDTPDFDSVYARNRVNAEALLVTVDLVLFVVSRQSYQNAALIDFLKEVVGHGRPYAVVYNEAASRDGAKVHLEKLAQDVGRPPVARFWAPHQPALQEDQADQGGQAKGFSLLLTEPLDGPLQLAELLQEPRTVAKLKSQAMRASLQDAESELRTLADACEARADPARRLAERINHELHSVGERAALRGVPADVLIEAFRDELDARSSMHRWVRTPFRALATALTQVGRQARRAWVGDASAASPSINAEEESLRDGLRCALEALAPELPAWEQAHGAPAISEALRELLSSTSFSAQGHRLDLPELRERSQDRAALYRFCRELVGHELKGGFREGMMQAMTTLVYSVPAGAAAAATVATGGMGHDAVIWGGTLLSTPLLEKFVDLLGAGLRQRVSRRWAEAHGATLAKALEKRFFARVTSGLEALSTDAVRRASELRQAATALSIPGEL